MEQGYHTKLNLDRLKNGRGLLYFLQKTFCDKGAFFRRLWIFCSESCGFVFVL